MPETEMRHYESWEYFEHLPEEEQQVWKKIDKRQRKDQEKKKHDAHNLAESKVKATEVQKRSADVRALIDERIIRLMFAKKDAVLGSDARSDAATDGCDVRSVSEPILPKPMQRDMQKVINMSVARAKLEYCSPDTDQAYPQEGAAIAAPALPDVSAPASDIDFNTTGVAEAERAAAFARVVDMMKKLKRPLSRKQQIFFKNFKTKFNMSRDEYVESFTKRLQDRILLDEWKSEPIIFSSADISSWKDELSANEAEKLEMLREEALRRGEMASQTRIRNEKPLGRFTGRPKGDTAQSRRDLFQEIDRIEADFEQEEAEAKKMHHQNATDDITEEAKEALAQKVIDALSKKAKHALDEILRLEYWHTIDRPIQTEERPVERVEMEAEEQIFGGDWWDREKVLRDVKVELRLTVDLPKFDDFEFRWENDTGGTDLSIPEDWPEPFSNYEGRVKETFRVQSEKQQNTDSGTVDLQKLKVTLK